MFDISNWWLEVLAEGTNEILDSVGDIFFEWIRNYFEDLSWIISRVNPLFNITVQIASLLLIFMAAKHLTTTYLFETDGDSEIEPLQYMVKITMTLAIIQSHSFIFVTLQNLATNLCTAIDAAFTISAPTLSVEIIMQKVMFGQTMNFFSLIIAVIYVIMIIMMFFKAFLRGIELAIQRALFPIFCVDFLSPGQEKWKNFSMSYGVTFFGYIIQYVCFRLSVSLFFEGTIRMVIAALAVIYFGIKSPKWIEKYVYTSGVGQTISGGARTAAYMVPSLVRMGK